MRLCRGALLRRGLVTVTSPKPLKRFYDTASVERQGDLWRVLLDSKAIRTPKGSFLELPTQTLAEGVAQEWSSQGEHVKPKEMPLMTLGCTAVDLVRQDMPACIDRIMPYLAMDTVCFEYDQELLAQQQKSEWGPLREWFQGHLGSALAVSRSLGPPNHPEATMAAVQANLQSRNEWELCALDVATSTAKSLVVAMALVDRDDVDAEGALRWALLEERFQIERWGLVEGEHDVAHQEAALWLGATRSFARGSRRCSL